MVLVFALALAPMAVAADPTSAQYCDGVTGGGTSGGGSGLDCGGQGVGGQQDPGVSSTGAGTTPVSTSAGNGLGGQVGQLPFTGWDLVSMTAIAVVLTTSGLALARFTRRGVRS
jgi:hypothetical protein